MSATSLDGHVRAYEGSQPGISRVSAHNQALICQRTCSLLKGIVQPRRRDMISYLAYAAVQSLASCSGRRHELVIPHAGVARSQRDHGPRELTAAFGCVPPRRTVAHDRHTRGHMAFAIGFRRPPRHCRCHGRAGDMQRQRSGGRLARPPLR